MTNGSASAADPARLREALEQFFGFDSFRPGQEEIVRRAVEGRDTLALMPTGAGKSLCYQLAAMLRPTPTLVVSPLIALMKDQLDNLPRVIGGQSTFINSSLDASEASDRLRAVALGRYRLIYAAPERLRQKSFVSALRAVQIGLVVIDEVHCVSMWGHDFRPDYLFIRAALEGLGNPAVLGLTATATPATERDIASALGRDLDVVRSTVERPNLRYNVQYVENEEERLRSVVRLARETDGPGIVYARARDRCEQVATVLGRNGVDAVHYHARMEPAQRTAIQEQFLTGGARVVVATTAFGMGIDKPDIRWVVLYNFPPSLESYVQMVGRAGRDGEPSVCTLFASGSDASNLRRFARADLPTVDALRAIYRVLRERSVNGAAEVTPDELKELVHAGEDTDPRVLVGMLERADLVRREYDAGRSMRILLLRPPADAPQRIERLLKQYADGALERAHRMISFAETDTCRHQQVAEHFGESLTAPCHACDVCDPPPPSGPDGRALKPLPTHIAPAILDAVSSLPWPVGVKGLVATLRGSVEAPPSAQRADGFGLLSGASSGTIRRWIDALVEKGNLEFYENDGFRLLRVARRDGWPQLTGGYVTSSANPARRRSLLPGSVTTRTARAAIPLNPDDTQVFDRLRAWRAQTARRQDVSAFLILSDQTLRAVAATRPRSLAELASLHGMGPAKVDRYGDDILAMVRETC